MHLFVETHVSTHIENTQLTKDLKPQNKKKLKLFSMKLV